MKEWLLWDSSHSEWDLILTEIDDRVFYQSYSWGEVQRVKGWRPVRLYAKDQHGKIISAVQVLVKNKYFISICWIPGGFVGNLTSFDNGFRRMIKNTIGARFFYIRTNIQRIWNKQDEETMKKQSWKRPYICIASGKSIEYMLDVSEDERIKLASKNWRHNLRRSSKTNLKIARNKSPLVSEIIKLYEEMGALKGLPTQVTEQELNSMFSNMNNHIMLFEGRNENNELIAIRAAGIFKDRGWDLLAAADYSSRKVYATHAILWELLKSLQNAGVKIYDMGGIDPILGKGVYDFKKGVGGKEIEYLGEYDWANYPFIRYLASMYLRKLR